MRSEAVEEHGTMSQTTPNLKIINGGQTGADRAALDWAIKHGIPHGGWCEPHLFRLMGQEQAHQGQRPESHSRDPEGLADPEPGLLPAIYGSRHGGDESPSGSVGFVDNFRHGMRESISCARKRTGRNED